MPNIFLSYRRDDSRHQTGRIYDRLVAQFGHRQVFKDVDSIPLGLDFREVLTERVGVCDVLLAVIGDEWLSIAGSGGTRRLDAPGDYVRIEVEAALNRNIPVIPVLVGNVSIPNSEELPESLRALAFRNGLHVRPDPDFHHDVDRLIRGIQEVVAKQWGAAPPPNPKEQGPVNRVVQWVEDVVSALHERSAAPVFELRAPEAPKPVEPRPSADPLPVPAPAIRTPQDTPPLPEQFGRYRLVECLRRSRSVSVYLAEDAQLKRRVVLRTPGFGTDTSNRARAQFLEAARAAGALDHPLLCAVDDVGEVAGRPYAIRAYIEGKSLAEAFPSKSIPPRQAAAIVGKLAVALNAAHKRNVIHGNLKPTNVICRASGGWHEPVIVDFGQPRVDEEDVGPSRDIYSLGVILYELLTGRLPAKEPSGASPLSGLDPTLEAICRRALARHAADRYPSMGDLAGDLAGFLRAPRADRAPSADAPATPAQPAVDPHSRESVQAESGPSPSASPSERSSAPGAWKLDKPFVGTARAGAGPLGNEHQSAPAPTPDRLILLEPTTDMPVGLKPGQTHRGTAGLVSVIGVLNIALGLLGFFGLSVALGILVTPSRSDSSSEDNSAFVWIAAGVALGVGQMAAGGLLLAKRCRAREFTAGQAVANLAVLALFYLYGLLFVPRTSASDYLIPLSTLIVSCAYPAAVLVLLSTPAARADFETARKRRP